MSERRSAGASEVLADSVDLLGGTAVFAGTAVPVQALLDTLEGGWSVEDFLQKHSTVRREQVLRVLREGVGALLAARGQVAGPASSGIARDKGEVLRRIRLSGGHIRALGVKRLSLFGSFARGDQVLGSDVDLLVEFAEGETTFDHLMALGSLLEELLGRKVQLVTRDGLSPHIGPHILAEAEHVSLAA